jgi:predicted 3-demethylubiquinone-9 3-methyltransferase (glyoxalase superfamily)
MPKITPFLWFDNNVEEAANFYTSIFKDSEILSVNRVGGGQVVMTNFRLNGQEFIALNGGPHFKLNEAFSIFVSVDTQEEVDYYWNQLTDGGEESQCGWLKDKFGLSWQIVPTALMRLMSDPNPTKSQNVMQAMLKMQKIVIADLQKAYDKE